MKSPHAAVLGLHAGQVERIMRRRRAVDQTLPRAIPARLSNIDRRQLSAAYPQSQKREIRPAQQQLGVHEFTGVNLGGPPPEKFKLSHLQRSLSTPTKHCGGKPAQVRIKHTCRQRPRPLPPTPRKTGSFGAGSTLQTHNAA
jgi:hypothetical protein